MSEFFFESIPVPELNSDSQMTGLESQVRVQGISNDTRDILQLHVQSIIKRKFFYTQFKAYDESSPGLFLDDVNCTKNVIIISMQKSTVT